MVSKQRRCFLRNSSGLFLMGSSLGLLTACQNNEKLTNVKSEVITASPPLTAKKKIFQQQEKAVIDNLDKVRNFNQTFADDIFLEKDRIPVFLSTLSRLQRIQNLIGYANFNLVGLDEALLYARRYSKIGAFTKKELALIDELFFFDATRYGFMGKKVIDKLTARVDRHETIKIPRSGHFLFRGDAEKKFHRLQKDIGPELILTSGVRSVVKQFYLFLAKVKASKGNLSLASRSLAPPGHSYHGIGDFDVGNKNLGADNFTARFAETKEYRKLIRLKYVDIRYTRNNQVGVRYEPWHIKVVSA